MATLLRTGRASRIFLYRNSFKSKVHLCQPVCWISTSKKKENLTINADQLTDRVDERDLQKQLEEHFGDHDLSSRKNRVEYGFDTEDANMDKFWNDCLMFWWISVPLFIVGTFMACIQTDFGLTSWYGREAYRLIEERERLGLPHVDPNYVDPSKIRLPTEQEIGDTEIHL